jgi:hypothetical protein
MPVKQLADQRCGDTPIVPGWFVLIRSNLLLLLLDMALFVHVLVFELVYRFPTPASSILNALFTIYALAYLMKEYAIYKAIIVIRSW